MHQRVLWLLEEQRLAYEVKRNARDPTITPAPRELAAVQPLGKSPAITDGNVMVAESGAIVEYLLDAYGQGRLRPPPGTGQGRQFTHWLHFAEGSAMPPLLMTPANDSEDPGSPGVGPSAAAQRPGTRAGAAVRRPSGVRRRKHIVIGCSITPQPRWRCAPCPRDMTHIEVNPEIVARTATGEWPDTCRLDSQARRDAQLRVLQPSADPAWILRWAMLRAFDIPMLFASRIGFAAPCEGTRD